MNPLQKNSRPPAGHLPALDGVRGVALLAVLAFHFVAHGPGEAAWPRWIHAVASAGWAGVDLFFVLSGFLITRILLAARGRPGAARTFYTRRALRIFPLYYAVLAVLTAVVLLRSGGQPGRQIAFDLAALWLYLTNFNVAAHGWGVAVFYKAQFTHLWTLAIEEQFYLLWPWAVWLLRRRTLAATCVAFLTAGPLIRWAVLRHGGDAVSVYVLTYCRADALIWGAAVAVIEAAWPADRVRAVGRFVGTLGVTACIGVTAATGSADEYAPLVQTVGYTAIAAACAGWVACVAVAGRPTRVLSNTTLRRVGLYSYGAYLFHVPLRGLASAAWQYGFARDPAALPWPLAAITAAILFAATLAVAAASYQLFERPWLRRRPS